MTERAIARTLVVGALAALLAGCGASDGSAAPPPVTPPATNDLPVTGQAVAELASFDRMMLGLLHDWSIPGGAIAVVMDGRLIFARGYGYANIDRKEAVQPDALFRIASVSKPITSAAILSLVESRKLDLDAKAFALLPDLPPIAGARPDARLDAITVRQLLWHAGGWDRDRSFDPMFQSSQAAQAVGTTAPASAETIVRWMRGLPLDFTPGTAYAYSNFGYSVLGRIIERVAGESYESYVKRRILAPAGITRMRLGHTLPSEHAGGEVSYYDYATGPSVFPGGGTVPLPDGAFYLEALDSHGGWIASAVDLVKFITAVDAANTRPDVLTTKTISEMIAPPTGLWAGSAYHYAMGWLVRPAENNWWHDGSLPGTASLIVRAGNGLSWAVLFNARAMSPNSQFQAQIDGAIWKAVGEVKSWPTSDLFAQFP